MTGSIDSNELAKRHESEVERYIMDVEIVPAEHGEAELAKCQTRIPFAELATLGTGLSSLPEATRTITQTIPGGGGETLYRCVFPSGVSGALARAKDGSGYLGTIMPRDPSSPW